MRLRIPLLSLLLLLQPAGSIAAEPDPAAAWADFCDRMKAVGQSLLSEEYPGTPEERAEGFRHLARTVGMALQWEVDFADPDFPAFYRNNDDVTKWGGPNVDNTYMQARIRGDATYRLSGNVAGLHDLIISARNGHMHQGKTGVVGDLDRRELEIDANGDFELMLGPEVAPGDGIQLSPDAEHVGIRQFFYDWEAHTPGEFHIERVSEGPTHPEDLEPADMVARLDAAARWVETSLPFWNRFSRNGSAELPPNTVIPPRNVPGGSRDIYYGGIPFELAPEEALLIETPVPDARYWSFQWVTYHWFESPDFANRQTSLNGAQAHVDADGKVRIVVSARDPGVQNWIDTAGRRRGRLPFRWIWSKDAPVPAARVVPVAGVRSLLPPDTPVFDAEARRKQIAARRAHVERRFRR